MGLAERKHISFELILPEDTSIYLKTDPEKVEHILNNLLANALKFTPEGGRVVVRSEINNDTAELVVADSGPGISTDEQKIIFKRYHQGEEGQKNENGGYGIGLALCKEYTEFLGGRIWVESEPAQGASFFVHLPLDPVSEAELSTLVPMGVKSQEKNPRTLAKILSDQDKKAYLLVVEDNPDLLHQLTQILGSNYHVHTATNGEEAYQQLQAQPELYDLIISDVMMPLMDGFMLLNKTRAHPLLGFIPVLFLTAAGSVEDKLKALRLGVDAFITKPFELVELLTQVENLVKKQQERKKHRGRFLSNDELAENKANSSIDAEKTPSYDEAWLQELEDIVRKNLYRTDFKITDIAFELHLSERTLRNYIKSYTGRTPLSYLQKARLDQALQLIKEGKYKTLGEIAYAVGFKDAQYFSRLFKKEFGKVPNDYM